MAAPPLVGFALVLAYVIAEALGFHAVARPEGDTVSEAASLGQAARAVQLIGEGQDPSVRHPVREGFLDRDRHELTPIEAAILARHPELVRLLQRSGARDWDSARTACFARLRLPQVLPDLGAAGGDGNDQGADVETTIRSCPAERTGS